jgi:two-component system cell cycle response regulator DivK
VSASNSAPSAPELQGTLLYIEDSQLDFEVLEAFVALHPGIRLLRAPTGREGVELARQEYPQVILLDMRLPDISGIEVVRILSEDIAAKRFRVLLLTANSFGIDVIKAMSLGAFEYLVKPLDRSAFEAALRRALGAPSAPSH